MFSMVIDTGPNFYAVPDVTLRSRSQTWNFYETFFKKDLSCYFCHLVSNLINSFRELGENMTDEELRAMIDEFDRDGDGESK